MSSGEPPPDNFREDCTERDESMLSRHLYQVKFGLEEQRLPLEIEAILHERDIPYRIIPMTDMWRGSPKLYRTERGDNGTYVTKEIATGVTNTIRRLQSDEFCETSPEESKYGDVHDE